MSRRGWGDDGIYWVASRSRFVGAISLGYAPDGKRIRKVVTGKTKQEVRDKLKSLHDELSRSVRSSRRYTIGQAVDDWLDDGMDGMRNCMAQRRIPAGRARGRPAPCDH